jgi:hypothetical protein
MVWKYGNPWLYPKHEFEQLKTIILTEALAREGKEKAAKIHKGERPELPQDVKQKKMLAAKNFHQAMSKEKSA